LALDAGFSLTLILPSVLLGKRGYLQRVSFSSNNRKIDIGQEVVSNFQGDILDENLVCRFEIMERWLAYLSTEHRRIQEAFGDIADSSDDDRQEAIGLVLAELSKEIRCIQECFALVLLRR
jgi:hypothetical protein